jgi:hypothetical protein
VIAKTGSVYRDQPKRGGMFDFGVLPPEILIIGVRVSGAEPRRIVRSPVISWVYPSSSQPKRSSY